MSGLAILPETAMPVYYSAVVVVAIFVVCI